MTRNLVQFIAVLTACVALSPNSGQAQGIHLGTRRVHVDLGQPHAPQYRYVPQTYGGYGEYGGFGGGYHTTYYPSHRSHVDWHDTTHYDYHPSGFQPHYDHYDYVPGHYDVHRSGHWDGHH